MNLLVGKIYCIAVMGLGTKTGWGYSIWQEHNIHSPYPEVVEETILFESEVIAALALVDVVYVSGDVLLELLLVVGLELTLRALEFLQI